MKSWRFLTIMLVAVAASAALAHLMELPGKLDYDASLYVMLHRTLYPTFGQTAGWAEGLALLSVIALAWALRKRRAAFVLTATAAACQAVAMALFLLVVLPANLTMAGWSLDAIPSDWTYWRDRWEFGHALRAVLETTALGVLVWSVIREIPSEETQQSLARRYATSPSRGVATAVMVCEQEGDTPRVLFLNDSDHADQPA